MKVRRTSCPLVSVSHEVIRRLMLAHTWNAEETCTKACYQCLLSYRNQFDHPLLDRHLIRPWLNRLGSSTITRQAASGSREAQYQQLFQQTDPNSNFERVVLAEIDEG